MAGNKCKQLLLLALLAIALYVVPVADALERNVWFPVADVNRTTASLTTTSPWGGPTATLTAAFLQRLNADGTPSDDDNPTWNVDNVFYFADGVYYSRYEIGARYNASSGSTDNGIRYFRLEIYNPTETDYTGAARIQLIHYTGTGALVTDGDSAANPPIPPTYWGGSFLPLINTTNTYDDIEWDGTNECFWVSVPAKSTVTLISHGPTSGYNRLYQNPTSGNRWRGSTLQLRKADGGLFLANMTQFSKGGWRVGATSAYTGYSDRYQNTLSGYEGIVTIGSAPATLTKLFLPFTRDKYPSDASLIWLLNASTATNVYYVVVCDSAANLVGGMAKWLSAHERVGFSPSQFLPAAEGEGGGEDATDFDVEIYGAAPVAISANWTFSPTTASMPAMQQAHNPDFAGSALWWSLGYGWTYGSGAVSCSAGTHYSVSQACLTIGKKYRVSVYVSACSAGSVTPWVGSTQGTPISTVGPHVQYLECTNSTLLSLMPSDDFAGTIQWFYARWEMPSCYSTSYFRDFLKP